MFVCFPCSLHVLLYCTFNCISCMKDATYLIYYFNLLSHLVSWLSLRVTNSLSAHECVSLFRPAVSLPMAWSFRCVCVRVCVGHICPALDDTLLISTCLCLPRTPLSPHPLSSSLWPPGKQSTLLLSLPLTSLNSCVCINQGSVCLTTRPSFPNSCRLNGLWQFWNGNAIFWKQPLFLFWMLFMNFLRLGTMRPGTLLGSYFVLQGEETRTTTV